MVQINQSYHILTGYSAPLLTYVAGPSVERLHLKILTILVLEAKHSLLVAFGFDISSIFFLPTPQISRPPAGSAVTYLPSRAATYTDHHTLTKSQVFQDVLTHLTSHNCWRKMLHIINKCIMLKSLFPIFFFISHCIYFSDTYLLKWGNTVTAYELLCLKNEGARISMFFTSNE